MMLYKLEIMDHKAAEKQGTLVSVLGSPIPVVLSKDLAIEVLPLPLFTRFLSRCVISVSVFSLLCFPET